MHPEVVSDSPGQCPKCGMNLVPMKDKKGDSSAHEHLTSPGVHVAENGTRFDPPVAKERIPDEAWACVMGGKVHYASMKKGDGECPVCGMNLVEIGTPRGK